MRLNIGQSLSAISNELTTKTTLTTLAIVAAFSFLIGKRVGEERAEANFDSLTEEPEFVAVPVPVHVSEIKQQATNQTNYAEDPSELIKGC